MDKKEYQKMTAKASNKSKVIPDCLNAFWVGGLICVIGQFLMDMYLNFGLDKKMAGTSVSISLVFLSILLTGCTVYQKLANIGGAGTLVPITGFANSVVSPAMEFKTEGLVLGLSANMFKIAGPVIVYGTVASVVYGIIYWICQMI